MAKADGLPLGDDLRCALANGFEQGGIGIGSALASGIKALDDIVSQHFQLVSQTVERKMFKMPKADEAGRDAGHHGRRFDGFAANRRIRTGDAERPCGGNAQAVHGLGTQKLPN